MSETTTLAIGVLASETGVTISTLRYYDEIGLITPVTRVGGKRRFDQDDVGRVNFIRQAKQVGFNLEEIGQILDDTSGGWAELVQNRLDSLRNRRAELDAMIATLDEIRLCGCSVVSECPRSAISNQQT